MKPCKQLIMMPLTGHRITMSLFAFSQTVWCKRATRRKQPIFNQKKKAGTQTEHQLADTQIMTETSEKQTGP